MGIHDAWYGTKVCALSVFFPFNCACAKPVLPDWFDTLLSPLWAWLQRPLSSQKHGCRRPCSAVRCLCGGILRNYTPYMRRELPKSFLPIYTLYKIYIYSSLVVCYDFGDPFATARGEAYLYGFDSSNLDRGIFPCGGTRLGFRTRIHCRETQHDVQKLHESPTTLTWELSVPLPLRPYLSTGEKVYAYLIPRA